MGRAVEIQAVPSGCAVVRLVGRGDAPLLDADADVVVDVSGAQAFADVGEYCLSTATPLVECVSDLSAEQLTALDDISRRLPVLRAENLALGNLLQRSVITLIAELLSGGAGPEVAIVERHARSKAHRPSATALQLAALWQAGSGHAPVEIASIRAGEPVSDHLVTMNFRGESLSIEHRVTDLSVAARGAVTAARWLAGRPPGLYRVDDIYCAAGSSRLESKAVHDR